MATQEDIDKADCFSLGIDAQIFVEGDADTVFWSAVFRHFAPSLKIRLYPSGGNSSLRGCVELEKILDRDGVNQYRILCFDSDYSRYWTGDTRYDLPFILQTYAYSFDNYNTLPQRLNQIIETVTRETDTTKINFDFQQFLLDYSKTVYPLFVYFVAKRKIDKHCAKPEFSNQTIFQQPFSNYNKIIKDIEILVLNQRESLPIAPSDMLLINDVVNEKIANYFKAKGLDVASMDENFLSQFANDFDDEDFDSIDFA